MFNLIARYVIVLMVLLASVIGLSALFNFESANAAPQVRGDIYIQDTGNVLKEEDKKWIIKQGKQLEDLTSAQISFLTIDNLDGQDIESYAKDVFKSYNLGDQELQNGILLVFSIEDDKTVIEVGDGLKDKLTDSKIEEILVKYYRPYLDYDKAFTKTYAALYNEVGEAYGLDKNDLVKIPDDGIPLIIKILIIAIIPIVALLDVILNRGRFFSSLINTVTRFLPRSSNENDKSSGVNK